MLGVSFSPSRATYAAADGHGRAATTLESSENIFPAVASRFGKLGAFRNLGSSHARAHAGPPLAILVATGVQTYVCRLRLARETDPLAKRIDSSRLHPG